MSKKFIGFVSKLYANVNLIVGWNLLQCSINSSRSSFVPSQRKNPSSIYLLYVLSLVSAQAYNMVTFKEPMKIQAYVGATLVHMAVPHNW